MNAGDLQELLALGVVALVIGIALWRRFRARSKPDAGCGSCASPQSKPTESPLRFHRRKP